MSSTSRASVYISTLLTCLAIAGCGADPGAPRKAATHAASMTDELAKSRNAPVPTFRDSARITNPYFPMSQTGGYRLIGSEGNKPYEASVTVQPETRTIDWAGGSTETLIARYESFLAGELIEVAVDYYAQADDGSVWYFGEDVTYFEAGEVTNHEGSWVTGRAGALPGLLIPARPAVGDSFWSEDFASQGIQERNKVIELDAAVDTPAGPRDDGLRIRAWQDDGTIEEKVYLPGVGVVLEKAPDSTLRLASG